MEVIDRAIVLRTYALDCSAIVEPVQAAAFSRGSDKGGNCCLIPPMSDMTVGFSSQQGPSNPSQLLE